MKSFKNFIRAMMRPAVTVSLVALVWYVVIQTTDVFRLLVASGSIAADQALLLIVMVVEFVLASGAMVVAFHYGSRTKERSEDVAEEEK